MMSQVGVAQAVNIPVSSKERTSLRPDTVIIMAVCKAQDKTSFGGHVLHNLVQNLISCCKQISLFMQVEITIRG